MDGLRFKVGELAIFVVAVYDSGVQHQGKTVEIVEVGPWSAGTLLKKWVMKRKTDYLIRTADGYHGAVVDWQLRKIDPPAEPAGLTRDTECEVEA
jgi:hypothetical protein